jgi:hypothetical protein
VETACAGFGTIECFLEAVAAQVVAGDHIDDGTARQSCAPIGFVTRGCQHQDRQVRMCSFHLRDCAARIADRGGIQQDHARGAVALSLVGQHAGDRGR